MANVPISAFTVPANTVGIGATGYSLTGSASASFMDLAGTWDTSGTPTAIKLNITNTASNAASLLMDLGTGGGSFVSVFRVGTDGNAYVLGGGNKGFYGYGVSTNGGYAINGSAVIVAENGRFTTNASIRFGSTTAQFQWNDDLFLTRRGAANLRLGAADTTGTTAPTPQFLSAQSWASSTTNNQTGANFTIDGSQGTGTGAGGSIIFRVAPAGGVANGVQNALATALTINSAGQILGGSGSISSPIFAFSGATNTGFYLNGGNIGVTRSNDLKCQFSNNFQLSPSYGIEFSFGSGPILIYDTTNTIALRNATAAQEFRVYETTTGTIYKAILGNRQLMKIAGAAFDNGAGASAGTLANAPAVGNPTKWIPIDDNGTTRYIPAW